MTTKAVASTHVMKKRTDEPDIYVDGGLPVLLPTAEAYAVGEPDTEAPPPEALDQIPVEVVGTFVASNDPDSIREHQPPKRQQQSSRSPPVVPPQWGVGLWKGCFRDVHCIHMVLYVAGLLYILLWILKSQNEAAPASCDVYLSCFWHKPGLAMLPFLVIYILFLTEFFLSSTHQYLRHIESISAALQYLENLYQRQPTLQLKIECYHMESKTVLYTDANGKLRTRTKRVKVVTFRGQEPVTILESQDVTAQRLTDTKLRVYRLTKIKLDTAFTADAAYAAQKAAFTARHQNRDACYNLFIHFGLGVPPMRTRLLTYAVAYEQVPWLVAWDVSLLAHVLWMPALPWRMWLSAHTNKVAVTIHKRLRTRGPPS